MLEWENNIFVKLVIGKCKGKKASEEIIMGYTKLSN